MFNKISLVIFVWFSTLFFLNLFFDITNSFDYLIFFASILIIFFIIIFQIFYLELNKNVILFEIFLVYFLLHLIYQVGYFGLRGSDSYIDYNFLKEILSEGVFSLKGNVRVWPMIHIYSCINSLTTTINPLALAKYFPSFISSIIVLPLYLFINKVYRNKKVALFSCLIFASIPQFMNFESLFVREVFGIFIMILFLYILYLSMKIDNIGSVILILLLIPNIILSHHLTSFLIIVFLIIYIFSTRFVQFFSDNYNNFINRSKIFIELIFIIIFSALISYWAFNAVDIIQILMDAFKQESSVTISYAEKINIGAPIVTLRGNLIYYGFYFFNFVFAFILFIKIIFIRSKQKIEDISFSIFFYFCMFLGFLSLYFVSSLPFPQRFLSFGWMLGIIPLASILINLKKRTYKNIFVVILVLFSMYNMYSLDQNYISGELSSSDVIAGEKEYVIATTIPFPKEYYAYTGLAAAVFDIQGVEQRTGGQTIQNLDLNQNETNPIVINKEMSIFTNLETTKIKAPSAYSKLIKLINLKNKIGVNKINDIGSIYILKRGD